MVGGIRPIMCTGPRWSEKTSSDKITLRVDRAQSRCSLIPIGKGCFVYQRNSQKFPLARRLLWRLTFSEITNELRFSYFQNDISVYHSLNDFIDCFSNFLLSLNVNQYMLKYRNSIGQFKSKLSYLWYKCGSLHERLTSDRLQVAKC